jgi:hypothetical protein
VADAPGPPHISPRFGLNMRGVGQPGCIGPVGFRPGLGFFYRPLTGPSAMMYREGLGSPAVDALREKLHTGNEDG